MIAVWIGGGLAAFMLAAASPAPTVSPSGPPPSASRSPQLDQLLERHRRALGHLMSDGVSWTGAVLRNGVTASFTEIADSDGRWKSTFTLPLGQDGEGNDDSHIWIQDINGNVVLQPLERRRSMLSRLLGFNSVLLDRSVDWTLDGPLTMDGRTVIRLHAKLNGYDGVLYLDQQTALVSGVEVAGRSVRYRKYQTFNGLVVPTSIEETEQDETVTTTVSSVTFPDLTAKDFEPPASRRPVFPTGTTDVGLDFEAPHSLIVLDVKVNGAPTKFLLDSGSSASLIDADEARSLKLPTAGSARVAGATLLQGTAARVDALDLGGVRFSPFVMEAVPLGLPASLRGYGISGILGYDVLAQVVARIDYARSRIRLIAPESFTYAGTGTVIALDPFTRVPHVATTLGESDPAMFTVDTGSDSGLIVYQDFATAHAHDFLRPGDLASDAPFNALTPDKQPDPSRYFGDLTQFNGAGGTIPVKTAYVARINLGKFTVDRVFTEIVLQPAGAFTPAGSDGLLGAAVLSKFGAVFLDYPGGRFILER